MCSNLYNMGTMIFVAGMIVACIMDMREYMVYRFVWLIASVGAGMLVVLRARENGVASDSVIELLFFVLLQQLWFGRFYGRADCHAFCVSALFMMAKGGGILDYLIHMLFVFLGLTVIQVLRRNVESTGRLKKPVPLIPYITVALGLWVDFMGRKWYI